MTTLALVALFVGVHAGAALVALALLWVTSPQVFKR